MKLTIRPFELTGALKANNSNRNARAGSTCSFSLTCSLHGGTGQLGLFALSPSPTLFLLSTPRTLSLLPPSLPPPVPCPRQHQKRWWHSLFCFHPASLARKRVLPLSSASSNPVGNARSPPNNTRMYISAPSNKRRTTRQPPLPLPGQPPLIRHKQSRPYLYPCADTANPTPTASTEAGPPGEAASFPSSARAAKNFTSPSGSDATSSSRHGLLVFFGGGRKAVVSS